MLDQSVEREHIPFAIAVGNDMFCEPDQGAVDFLAFRDALRKVEAIASVRLIELGKL